MGKLVGQALKHQYNFITSQAKYTALVSGLGAGKTEALIYKTLNFISTIPKAQIGIFEPTYDLIRSILYPRFEEIFQNSGILYKLNKSEGIMEIWMPQGKCRLIFKSMDNPARIIGAEYHHSLIDEVDVLPKDKAMDVWVRVIARTRKKFLVRDPNTGKMVAGKNTVSISTTPEGFGFTYTLWMKDHRDNPEYRIIRGRTMDNHHLPADYVDSLRKTYPPQLIKAYLEGEFVNMIGATVYSSFDREKSHTDLTMEDFPVTDAVHIGMDFNISRGAAAVVMKGNDGRYYQVDEIHHTMDTPEMIVAIQSKYPDRVIIIYPDASGRSRKSIDASKSDIRLLRDAGFRINAPKKNPPVRERVVSLNTAFMNADGERNLLVNTRKCPHTTEMLEKQVYDDNSVPIKDGNEDILDALGYVINRIAGLAKPTTNIGRMRFAV